ncbi:hypothetical protein K440DRAFT_662317 [Wilcoxina mikolae CBS 423.85]|nr:hypothetical protein K440DRAFT_662317 [Wilcoxina mikolae CBS 423.85]
MASGSFRSNAPPSASASEAQKLIRSPHTYMPAGMHTLGEQSEPVYTQYWSSDSPPVSEDGNSTPGGNGNQLRITTSPVIIQPDREPEDALRLYHKEVPNITMGVTSPHKYNDNTSFGTASSTAQPPDHLPQRVFFEDVKKKVIRTALCPSGRTVAFLTKEAVLVALLSGLEAEPEVTINEELSKLDLEGTGWNRVVIRKEKILVIGNIKDGKTILSLCYMPEGLRQGEKIARQQCYEFMNVARTEMSSQGILLLQKSDSIKTGPNLDMLSPMPGLENLKKQDHHIKDVSFSTNGKVVVAVVGTKNPGWYCWKRTSGQSWAAPQFGYLSGSSASLSNMMLTPFSRHDGFMASGTAPGYKVSLLVKEEKAKYRKENVSGLSSSILRAYIGPRDKAIFAITSPIKRLGTSSEIWEAKMAVSGDGQKQICGKAALLARTCRGLHENEDVVIVDSDEGRFIWIAYNNGSLQKIPFGS